MYKKIKLTCSIKLQLEDISNLLNCHFDFPDEPINFDESDLVLISSLVDMALANISIVPCTYPKLVEVK